MRAVCRGTPEPECGDRVVGNHLRGVVRHDRVHVQGAHGLAPAVDQFTDLGFGACFVRRSGGGGRPDVSLPMVEAFAAPSPRSEERRVGTECVSTCRSRWSPYHSNNNSNNTTDTCLHNTTYASSLQHYYTGLMHADQLY